MKLIYSLFILTLCSTFSFGQYYYLSNTGALPNDLNGDPAFPAGGGQEVGWTSILGPDETTPVWSADQAIPFAFDFNGAAVTDFKVSSTGVLTFDVAAVAVPGATPAALPDANIPDNSVCLWGLVASGSNDNVSTKTFGTAPNRQHWIHFSSNANPGLSWTYWSIVLEETTNTIYLVDQRNDSSGDGAITAGIQVDAATAYSVMGSPALASNAGTDATSADDIYYEFFYGVQDPNEVELVSFDILPYIAAGANTIAGTVKNLGSDPITVLDITWDDGSGANADQITGLNIPSNGTYSFTHATTLTAVTSQTYTIDLTAFVTGDVNATNNTLQASTTCLSSIPTRVVVGEEKTGTWCGFCPRGAVGLAGMESEPNFIGIAVHNGDPMTINSYDGSIGTYISGGYPRGGVDRVADGNPADFATMFANRASDLTPCAVDNIDASVNGATGMINVSADVEFFGTISGDYRLSMIILEDDVIGSGTDWPQVNYYDGGGQGALLDPVTGFDWTTAGDPVDPADFGGYDHVARYLSNNDILGDAGSLPSGSVSEGLHSHTFTGAPATSYDDINKVHVVVMIVNATTGEILNAGKAEISNLSIAEVNNTVDFAVYPNPANDLLNVAFTLTAQEKVSIKIVDGLGKVVMTNSNSALYAGEHKTTINTSSLSEGIYFVNVTVGDQVSTKKFVIAK